VRSSGPPADLSGFPQASWQAGKRAYRVYRHTDPETGEPRTPLFFASGTGGPAEGRWDLPSPEGACYLADDEVVSVLEVLVPDLPPSGPPRLVADVWLRRRRRIEIVARADSGPYADLDAEEACGFGVAGDLHTTDDRSLTQRWAAALRRHEMIGIRAHARTPPGGRAGTWSLFGPAGPAQTPPGPALVPGPSVALHDDAALLHRLRDHGVEVLPVPNEVDAD
jgi:hypothetical protein